MQTWETTSSVWQLLSHTKEALMIMPSQEIPDVHTVARVTPLMATSIHTVTHPISSLCLEIRPSPDRMKLLDGGGGGVYWG